jgi:magnesium-transporting ATPase (P-type)
VREGRTVYDNLRKVIAWTLPTNGGEALTILLAILLGIALPITAVQILWVNMITASALGLTLAFEPPEPGVMTRPPRRRSDSLLSWTLLWQIAFVSFLMASGTFGAYTWAVGEGRDIETARTMAVNALVMMEIFYLFSIRYLHGASFSLRGVLGTRAVLIGLAVTIVAQLAFTYWGPMNALFGSHPLDLGEGLIVFAIGVALFAIVEAEKAVRGRLFAHRGTGGEKRYPAGISA